MARQGKMAHSPFHVESERYRYAMERGEASESYHAPRDCTYYVRATRGCNLWNSGFKTCTAFKCKYYTHRLRTQETCASCGQATVYTNGVKCSVCKRNVQLGEGNYCCYFTTAPGGKATHISDKIPAETSRTSPSIFSSSQKMELVGKSKNTPYYGKRWCLTGKMAAIERPEIIDLIHRMKGVQVNGITGVGFVVKGCAGKQTYKAKEARKMIANGINMQLMDEYEFIKIVKTILR